MRCGDGKCHNALLVSYMKLQHPLWMVIVVLAWWVACSNAGCHCYKAKLVGTGWVSVNSNLWYYRLPILYWWPYRMTWSVLPWSTHLLCTYVFYWKGVGPESLCGVFRRREPPLLTVLLPLRHQRWVGILKRSRPRQAGWVQTSDGQPSTVTATLKQGELLLPLDVWSET
jgi:hypothetical protein